MKAIVYSGRNEVQLTDLPDPQPGSSEIVIEVKASGICHTDYEVLKANYGTSAFPVVPGHEFAGTVAEVGSEVTDYSVGDRVVVDPNFECGTCRASKRGWAHLCDSLGAYGVTTNGGFSEYCVVKVSNVHSIGELSFAQAALSEPMGCVLNGVDAVHSPWMESALIFGAGPMGLLMGMALKAQGIPEVTFCDMSDSRVELADSFGFEAFNAGSQALDAWHHRADLVVEATGVTAVAAKLTDYIANGGKGLFFGVCPSEDRVDLAPFDVFRRQLTLAGSHSLNHNIPEALAMISRLGSAVDPLISHQLPLGDIAQILRSKPPAGSLKVHAVSS